jgi:predicted dehydrogenase
VTNRESTARSSLTIGVIGTGSVANKYLSLTAALRAQGHVGEIVACDIDATRLAAARAKFAIDRVTDDASVIIDDEGVDIVLVLTSMNEHASLTKQALLAGKHVLVEKPMATTLEESAELVDIAHTSRGWLVCAPHVLLSDDFQTMYRKIVDGEIGRPLLARSRYGWDGPNWGKWFYAPGGGALFDLGVYSVTSLTGLLGAARRVIAMSTLTRPERVVDGELIEVGTDDTYQIVIEHVGGALSTVTTAFGMQKYRGPALEVYGLEGTIQMLGDDWAPEGLELWTNASDTWRLIASESKFWPWTDGLNHLVACVQAGTAPYTTPEHAHHVLELMLAAMRAAETGAAQEIASHFGQPAPRPVLDRGPKHRVHDRNRVHNLMS